MAKNSASLVSNKLPALLKGVNKLATRATFVGVPSEKTERKADDEDEDKKPMTNAALAFIHDNGSAAAHIPARPFMRPGIKQAQGKIVSALKMGAIGVLKGQDPERALNIAGMAAQASIRGVINEGIAPPLADSTLRGRIRNKTSVKGAKKELADRAAGAAPGVENAKPLIATAQLRNSINYVIRKNK